MEYVDDGTRGLSEEEVQAATGRSLVAGPGECLICMDEMNVGEEALSTTLCTCRATFHPECLSRWPVCRGMARDPARAGEEDHARARARALARNARLARLGAEARARARAQARAQHRERRARRDEGQ
jgi:hypothetical protein